MAYYAEDSEFIDVYDQAGIHLGVASRREAHDRGLWHKASHLWVFWRAPKGNLKVLFQRRSASKRFFPGKLDVAAAGHYRAGETLMDGVRELEEELGIPATAYDVRHHATRRFEHCDESIMNREFWEVFRCQLLADPHQAKIDPAEVDDLIMVDVDDMLALLDGKVPNASAESVITGALLDVAFCDFIGDYRAYFQEMLALKQE